MDTSQISAAPVPTRCHDLRHRRNVDTSIDTSSRPEVKDPVLRIASVAKFILGAHTVSTRTVHAPTFVPLATGIINVFLSDMDKQDCSIVVAEQAHHTQLLCLLPRLKPGKEMEV